MSNMSEQELKIHRSSLVNAIKDINKRMKDKYMKCINCDGQYKVIWRDGVATPAYPWNAKEDMEDCPSCSKKGESIWEGSFCAKCGKAEVKDGKFISSHDFNCEYYNPEDSDSFSCHGTPANIWMTDLDEDDYHV